MPALSCAPGDHTTPINKWTFFVRAHPSHDDSHHRLSNNKCLNSYHECSYECMHVCACTLVSHSHCVCVFLASLSYDLFNICGFSIQLENWIFRFLPSFQKKKKKNHIKSVEFDRFMLWILHFIAALPFLCLLNAKAPVPLSQMLWHRKSMRKRILWESDSILSDSDNTTRKVGSHLSSFACDYLCQSFRRFFLLLSFKIIDISVCACVCVCASVCDGIFSLCLIQSSISSTLAVFWLHVIVRFGQFVIFVSFSRSLFMSVSHTIISGIVHITTMQKMIHCVIVCVWFFWFSFCISYIHLHAECVYSTHGHAHLHNKYRRERERERVVACTSRFYSPGLLIDLKRSSKRDNFFKWIILTYANDIIGETFSMTSPIDWWCCCWCAHHSIAYHTDHSILMVIND